jgi:methylenetetrahydrofolate--tRNA-(uracil-5-)-methyltransferase
MVQIVGGGLAGCEAAWQVASRGVPVTLFEMRPERPTAVHKTDRLAELVCSNSFRGDKLDNAVGLLKEEMRRLDSLIMRAADASRVPAGAALAVDRERFARLVSDAVASHPRITLRREEIAAVPESNDQQPVILATGPLTSEALSADLTRLVGSHLYFYDAISPIVLAETIDRTKVFRQSRWDRSLMSAPQAPPGGAACGADDGQGDYLNCPLTSVEYERFYDALIHAESATVHDFDKERFFEGCLPIEVMAHRGRDTLRFGPMKPVGLVDSRTGRTPYAVVQLRQDNLAADHFSLVGFQTQIKWGEQARVLRLIPGLDRAEFVRFGMVHRNTYVNGPRVLRETWQMRNRPSLFLAGQMSGVEGYVESAASGLLAGINAAALVRGERPTAPPRTTAIGALAFYASHANPDH